MKSKEWRKYRVGQLPSSDWTPNDCVPFDSVHHNSHVGDAFRVFADGHIQSTLIWDESILRETRTCVSWVSANTWANGSIYGNVRFEFDWKSLIADKKFYWVEVKTGYRPPAFRILISDELQSGLSKYDVESGDGPIFYHVETDTWYRNGEYTSEFMIDSNLSLEECKRVIFDNHHTSYCRKDECNYVGKSSAETGAELIARLLAHRHRKFLKLFHDKNSDYKCLNSSAASAYLHLRRAFKVPETASGNIKHDHPAAEALVSAIADGYGFSQKKGMTPLLELFKSTEELRLALSDRMMWAFGVTSENALRGEEEE